MFFPTVFDVSWPLNKQKVLTNVFKAQHTSFLLHYDPCYTPLLPVNLEAATPG